MAAEDDDFTLNFQASIEVDDALVRAVAAKIGQGMAAGFSSPAATAAAGRGGGAMANAVAKGFIDAMKIHVDDRRRQNRILVQDNEANNRIIVESDREANRQKARDDKAALQAEAIRARKAAAAKRALDWLLLEARKQVNREINIAEREAVAQRAQRQRAADRAQATLDREAASKRVAATRAALTAETQAKAIAARKEAAIQTNQLKHEQRQEEISHRSHAVRMQEVQRIILRSLQQTYHTGLNAILSTWKSHLAKRNSIIKGDQDQATAAVKRGMAAQEAATRLGLNEQNASYTRSAQRQLAAIERNQAKATQVIRAGAVKQAAAVQEAQRRSSSGIVGAVTGRSGIGAAVAGIAGGFGGLMVFRTIIGEATEAQKVGRDTIAVLNSTRHAAGLTGREIANLATRQSLLSGVDDELIQSNLNVLLTFTKVRNEVGKGNDIFTQASQAALDMSARMKIDLKGATVQVGKALQDPIKGITALRRVGVNFSADQVKVIKSLVESGRSLDAQKLILRELRTEFAGAAAANATAGAKMKVAFLNMAEAIGVAVLPLFNRIATVLAKVVVGITQGEGAWAVLRHGLVGVGVALGALLAAKGGVEVLGLIKVAISGLAAHPFILIAAGIGALAGALSQLGAAKGALDTLKRLAVGTVEWIKVGFKLGRSVDGLSLLTRIATTIGATGRKIVDFFVHSALVIRSFTAAGYAMKRAVTGFSVLGTVASSIGAAARVIVDGLGSIGDAFKALFSLDFDTALADLRTVWDDVWAALTPAASAISDAAGKLYDAIVGAVSSAVSAVQRTMGDLLGGLFTGQVVVGDSAVRQLGAAIHDLIVAAFDVVKFNVGDFFANLFGRGQTDFNLPATDTFGEKIGTWIHDQVANIGVGRLIVAGIITAIGIAVAGPVAGIAAGIGAILISKMFAGGGGSGAADGEASKSFADRLRGILASAGDVVSNFFTSVVVPKLIELPRVIGRFISRTLFSEAFLKGLSTAVGAVALVVAGMAASFVRGFAEGLWQRRGDIARAIRDVILAGVGLLFGSGNPFLFFGGLIVAGLAVVKIRAALSSLNTAFSQFQKKHETIAKLVERGNLAIRSGIDRAAVGAYNATGKIAAGASKIAPAFTRAIDSVKRVSPGIGAALTSIEVGARKAWDGISTRASAAWSTVKTGASNMAARVKQSFTDAFSGAEGKVRGVEVAMTAVAGAVSGRMLTMSQNSQEAIQGIIGAAGSVATAFAVAGPVGGAIAAFGVVVGAVLGTIQRRQREVAAEQKRLSDAINRSASDTRSAFDREGFDSTADRARAGMDKIVEALKRGDAGTSLFTRRLGGSLSTLAVKFAEGGVAAKRYTDALASARLNEIFKGNAQTIERYWSRIGDAVQTAQNRVTQGPFRTFTGLARDDLAEAQRQVDSLFASFRQGNLTFDQLKQRIIGLGFNARDVTLIFRSLRGDIEKGVKGGVDVLFGETFSAKQKEILADMQERAELEDKLKSRADKVSDAYDAMRGAVDKVRTAVMNLWDAQNGQQLTQNQVLLGSIDAQRQVADIQRRMALPSTDADFLSRAEGLLEIQRILLQQQQDVNGLLGDFATQSGENYDTFRRQAEGLRDEIANNLVKSLGISREEADKAAASFVNIMDRDQFNANVTGAIDDAKVAISGAAKWAKDNGIDIPVRVIGPDGKPLTGEALKRYLGLLPGTDAAPGDRPHSPVVAQQALQSHKNLIAAIAHTLRGQELLDWLKNLSRADRLFALTQVPRAADGRIVRRKTLLTVGESGPEVILPITRPQRALALLGQSGLLSKFGPKPQPIDTGRDVGPLVAASVAAFLKLMVGASLELRIFMSDVAAGRRTVQTLAEQLRGIAALARRDAAARAFFEMMRGASQSLRDFMAATAASHTLEKPVKELKQPLVPSVTPVNVAVLPKEPTTQPITQMSQTEFDRNFARLVSALETGRDAPMVGELTIVEASNPRATAASTVTAMRSERFRRGVPR